MGGGSGASRRNLLLTEGENVISFNRYDQPTDDGCLPCEDVPAAVPEGCRLDVTRSNPVPLYWQLQEWLRDRIRSGAWSSGDAVPTEQELAVRFGVSRTTVRQALAALVHEGLIHRRPGKGTFVARPKIGQALDTLRGFAEELRLQGLAPDVEVLHVGPAPAPREAREALRLRPAERTVRIDRLVRVEGQPLLWDRSFVSAALGIAWERQELTRRHVFELAEAHGFAVEEAEQTIEAAGASRSVAHRLGVPFGAPVLLVRRLTFAAGDRPLIFSVAVYRGDRYRYRVALKRQRGR